MSKGENFRLRCGAAPKTRGDHGTKADENRVHEGDDYDLTNDRKLCVCRSDGVFSTHNPNCPLQGDFGAPLFNDLKQPVEHLRVRASSIRESTNRFEVCPGLAVCM